MVPKKHNFSFVQRQISQRAQLWSFTKTECLNFDFDLKTLETENSTTEMCRTDTANYWVRVMEHSISTKEFSTIPHESKGHAVAMESFFQVDTQKIEIEKEN